MTNFQMNPEKPRALSSKQEETPIKIARETAFVDSFLKDLIPHFLENRQKDLTHFNKLLNDKNLNDLVYYSQRLREASLNYGFVRLVELCLSLEKGALQNDLNASKQAVTEMHRHLSSIEIQYVCEQ